MRTFFLAFVLLGLSVVPATAAEKLQPTTISRAFICLSEQALQTAEAKATSAPRTATASAGNEEDAKYQAHLEATGVCKQEGQLYRWSGDWQIKGS
jgi:hypothetical protein